MMNFLFEQLQNLTIGRPKSNRRLRRFEKKVFQTTKNIHKEIIDWADYISKQEIDENLLKNSKHIIVREAYNLKISLLSKFEKCFNNTKFRILLHTPSDDVSIAHNSWFTNFAEALTFLGVPTRCLKWDDDLSKVLEEFQPSVFISLDDSAYFKNLDWRELFHFRSQKGLKLALNASIPADCRKDETVADKVKWGKKNRIDFYFCFYSKQFMDKEPSYGLYTAEGFKIFRTEYGANIFNYFPIPSTNKDLDYVFLGSSNRGKRPRYHQFFSQIFWNYKGFYDGPGFSIYQNRYNFERDKFIYSRAKVGLNLHMDHQLQESDELNERAYMYAACGIPQLTDKPKILFKKFPEDSLFVATTPKRYLNQFSYILNHQDEAKNRALKALKHLYANHTTIHTAKRLIEDLITL